ncbi:FecR family protein [Dinghuibacter silviterrae]|uniref:FecR family protein n=1 Tax=Dinghuibacter silviterrae TaxID=1539049 RepID=A0A4R8DRX5_9BACT|nr:FecR family protein [Dinghuibacter silviterrae]TDX00982.1 FecR family protein [Dinghuibacter silviterrae]
MEPKDEHIRLLLQRYKDGQCTTEELALLHAWLDAQTAGAEGEAPVFGSAGDRDRTREALWAAVNPRRGRVAQMRWMWAAAAILLLGVSSWVAYTLRTPAGWDTYATTDQSRLVALADGSKVWMDHFTTIRIAKDFKRRRDIQLDKGSVFCDVAHDTDHPFRVASGVFDVRDLGTAFSVSRYERWQGLKVAVIHGIVEVRHGGDVVDTLYKEQRLRYTDGARPQVIRDSIAEGEADGWISHNIVLHDLTLEEVAQWIEMHYGLHVVNLTQASVRTYEVQLDKGAGVQDMLDILNLILQNNHIELTKSDTTVTIRSSNHH